MDAHAKNSIGEHIVNKWLNGDPRGPDDETGLQRIGVLDSFSTLEVVSFVVETFHVQIDPSDVNSGFRTIGTIRGKPALAGRFADSELRFTLSHCDDLAICAVSHGRGIGVDGALVLQQVGRGSALRVGAACSSGDGA